MSGEPPLQVQPWITLAVGILTFWLGNRYALGRDKRREWNELTLARRQALRQMIVSHSSEDDLILDYLPFYSRRGFSKALKRHQDAYNKAAIEYDPMTGDALEVDPVVLALAKAHLRRCTVRLLRYYRRR